MTIALIDYGAGNLHSVANALTAAGATDLAVTADPDIVAKAERIVLPGVDLFERLHIGQHDQAERRRDARRLGHHSVPLVEGIESALRGSISTAARKARARPLNADSMMWWLFLP
jgi:hypothetical protein